VLGVRPQYFTVHRSPVDGAAEATVTVTEPMGDEQLLTAELAAGGAPELAVRVPIDVDVTRGASVWLEIDQGSAYFFDAGTGERMRTTPRPLAARGPTDEQ
jgi:multiple sugar transport system ATP-binding protein